MKGSTSNLHLIIYAILLISVLPLTHLQAQAPLAIPYQAVARDSAGNLIANQTISLQFTIRGLFFGPINYRETQTVNTNEFGLFTAYIGYGNPVIGNMNTINWAVGILGKSLIVEMDVTGGTNYVLMGSSPILSVPYALYATTSGNGLSPGIALGNTIYWDGSSWVNDSNIYNNGNRVGIGTTSPEFKLSLDNDGGIIAKGTLGSGTDLTATGAGARMIWYPKKAAFRAGYIVPTDNTAWDDSNIGLYSFAAGNGTKAFGESSVVLGNASNAIGYSAVSIGALNSASVEYATAIGYSNLASGFHSMSMGNATTASGPYSIAIGNSNIASGANSVAIGGGSAVATSTFSIAIGSSSTASAQYSTALGTNVTASGQYSTALGANASTAGHNGSFCVGDHSNGTLVSQSDNSFQSRFAGGFTFYSDANVSHSKAMFLLDGKLGIGMYTPEFKMSLDNDGGIIAKGTFGSGSTLTTAGAGTRMIWYPKKGAFRAGTVTGTQWNDINIGNYSFAAGSENKASELGAVAMGINCVASGRVSFAMGEYSVASNAYNFSYGYSSNSVGMHSIAIGEYTTASALASVAIGGFVEASGDYSLALGYNNSAGGFKAAAIGYTVSASGDYSTAMGHAVSTNYHNGAFIIGDNSTNTYMNSLNDNGFKARFAGGYKLYSDAATTVGVYLQPGAGSWTVVSDRNKKENFQLINNEEILLKVGAISLNSWNYKTQESSIRHVGPMAQDFYAAFHLDGESDTTINTVDIDGINMAAIQALKTRTDQLQKATDKIDVLIKEMAALKEQVAALAKNAASSSALLPSAAKQ